LDKVAQGKEQYEKHQSADPVLQDELPYEGQIEVIPQSGDLENRQQDAQKKTDTKQPLIAPDKGDHAIQRLVWFHRFEQWRHDGEQVGPRISDRC
jgi:hypothetical protein